MLTVILFLAVCCVAFTNGANANFKGVASLYGSGTTTLRGALLWGTAMTFAGSIAAAFLAEGLLKKFSGRGIVPDTLAQSPEFVCAVAIGAALTSFLAQWFIRPRAIDEQPQESTNVEIQNLNQLTVLLRTYDVEQLLADTQRPPVEVLAELRKKVEEIKAQGNL